MSRYLSAYSKYFKYQKINPLTNINASSGSFELMASFSGVGYISSFELKFNSPDVLVRVTVDNEIIIDVDVEDLYDNLRDFDGITRELFVSAQDFLVFNPKNSISFKENFKLECKSNDSGTWKDFLYGHILFEGVS